MAHWIDQIKRWARTLKRDIIALWIAARSPLTPWAARLAAAAVAAYALSPIDLIPDFIPIIGYLDDLVIVPIGIALTIRLIAPDLLTSFRAEAELRGERPKSYIAAGLIASLWVVVAAAAGFWVWGNVS